MRSAVVMGSVTTQAYDRGTPAVLLGRCPLPLAAAARVASGVGRGDDRSGTTSRATVAPPALEEPLRRGGCAGTTQEGRQLAAGPLVPGARVGARRVASDPDGIGALPGGFQRGDA